MKKRILACLLALVMLIGLLPVTALAVDAGGTTVPMLDVSKSKTATALDASGQTQITLSLPSAEMKKTLDVVFVVDNAFPKENQDAAQKAAELLEQLSAIGTGGNLTINVGLVISGGYIPVLKEISLADITNASHSAALKDAITDPNWKNAEGRKGSNIQAGIEAARKMLDEDTDVSKGYKYLILISDGGAFSWYDKTTGKTWAKFYAIADKAATDESDVYYWCNPYVADNNYVTLYRVDGVKDKYPLEYNASNTDTVFDSINNDLTYLVAAGSKVEDTIGSNFELVSIDSLTVDGQKLDCTRSGNTYNFGNNAGQPRFVVTYDAENKMLTWNINETITKANTVQLKYTLKLTNPKSTAGTNGVNDLDGDGKEDATGKVYDPTEALYTNESAYLFPKDSTDKVGEKQEFPKPSVAVDENAIPDYLLPILNLKKAAPKLNTRDHFAYVQGYPDGTVKPAGSITRAEVAAILFRLMDADSRSLYYSTASGFRDVDSAKWYNTYVATLNNAGVITDSRTGYFRPNDAITRAELAAMLAQFAEKKSAAIYFSDISAGYWAANAIALTANLGWINGYPDGTFGPDKTVTRAELMAMVNRATGRAPESADALLPNMKTWKDNADTARWYYLDVQEATNSHTYTGAPTETWTSLTATPDWSQYE